MKLMLVDDHSLFLEGLQYLLETYGLEVAGTADNGLEALQKARALKPDIILMDIMMPVCGGIDALRLIKTEMPEIKVVMLTTSVEDENLFEAVKYGASGYLLKSTNAKELVEMLSVIEKGEVPFSKGLAERLLMEFMHKDKEVEQKGERLSTRQLTVLEMVARGMTYKQAGEALGLTERTVKYHMGRIIELLHLKNRSQVIGYAAKMGIIEKEL